MINNLPCGCIFWSSNGFIHLFVFEACHNDRRHYKPTENFVPVYVGSDKILIIDTSDRSKWGSTD